ncbi:CBS domain-containing protein [Candidatus Saccharibacteria bacterium]|nr:CBS domain-containing protein [Candidatus Saccharibacteria bacterium]
MTEKKKQNRFMVWLANKLGPKLDKYRKEPEPEVPEIYLPETEEDLVWVLKKLPESVISSVDREKIMMAMTFSEKKVRDVMLPRAGITFVHINDFMGPLTLDKLYQSGFSHFPVLDVKGGIAGVIHTSSLNSLEIKDTDRASSFLDKNVYYMRDNYTLTEALAAFLRTNSYFFMVVNSDRQVVGLLTLKMLIGKLLGEVPEDDFVDDDSVMAVAKR